jgi:predicted butyrate kinase (DUF1464 family)
MPRVIGIDPGTVSIDLCGLEHGRVFLDESLSTMDALRDPAPFVARLQSAGPLDLIVGPSGYGLPCVAASDLTDEELRLAFLAAEGESAGIGGLRALVRALGRSGLPILLTPGVIHLPSVPAYRKVNRVDMGTADKVCSVALAIREQADRRRCRPAETGFVLLELGGAFTAAIAVQAGCIVDGIGGSSGPIGLRASGALDGEVAFLAGHVSKSLVFSGGALTIAAESDAGTLVRRGSEVHHLAFDALMEAAAKAVVSLLVSAPDAHEVVLSGRMAAVPGVCEELADRIGAGAKGLSIAVLTGFAASAMQAAQGAALLADGLAGGANAELVERLGIREARGTVLDHLYVISQQQARMTLGLT